MWWVVAAPLESEEDGTGTPMESESAMVLVGSERTPECAKAGGGRGMPGDGGRDELEDAGPIAGVGQA